MKKSYLHLFVVVAAFGLTGCLEDLAAPTNNTANQTENQNANAQPAAESSTTEQPAIEYNYAQLIANQTVTTTTATNPVVAETVVAEQPADPVPAEPF